MGSEHLQNLDVSWGHELEYLRSDRGRPGRSGSLRSETFDSSQAGVLIGHAAPETGAVRFMNLSPSCGMFGVPRLRGPDRLKPELQTLGSWERERNAPKRRLAIKMCPAALILPPIS